MDGVLIVDKAAGWTSHDVVARVRRVLGVRRVGHTGTLDPFATGVLVILVGRATRLAQFLAGAEKEYEATIRFGYATQTGDLTGARREPAESGNAGLELNASVGDGAQQQPSGVPHAKTACAAWSEEEIERALASLRGEIEQVPPMYSAKKVRGKKLYELARLGVEIERAAVKVTIREFEVLHDGGALLRENDDGTCDLCVRVVCSAGTYIRVLAEDVGARLGAGAHLSALRRTRAGAFHLSQAVTLEALAARVEAGGLSDLLVAPGAALPALPFVHLTDEDARRARHGAAVGVTGDSALALRDGEQVRLGEADGRLIAIGVYDAQRAQLQPRVMLDAGDEK